VDIRRIWYLVAGITVLLGIVVTTIIIIIVVVFIAISRRFLI